MNADSFDQLSRRMGAAGSRRGLLRAFVGGVAAAVAGSLAHTSDTRAQQMCSSDVQCPVAQRCLNGFCVADSDPAALAGSLQQAAGLCGYAGHPCCQGVYCNNDTTYCDGGTCRTCGTSGAPCCGGNRCVQVAHICNSSGVCQFCTPGWACGNACCAPNERCYNGTCISCGYIGQTCCPDGSCGTLLSCKDDNICRLF